MAAPSHIHVALLRQSIRPQHPICRPLNMSRGPAWGRGRPPAGGQLLGEGGPNGRAFAGGRGGGGGGAVAPLVGVAAARDATSGGGEDRLGRLKRRSRALLASAKTGGRTALLDEYEAYVYMRVGPPYYRLLPYPVT